MRSALPLVFDLTDRLVVLVGGGRVAARRAATFLAEGARVVVIAPELAPAMTALMLRQPDRLRWRPRRYAGPSDLAGAWLVHTATSDPQVDAAVSADSEATRTWCIDATRAAATRVSVPARTTARTSQGDLLVAAYAGGDPVLSRRFTRWVAATRAQLVMSLPANLAQASSPNTSA